MQYPVRMEKSTACETTLKCYKWSPEEEQRCRQRGRRDNRKRRSYTDKRASRPWKRNREKRRASACESVTERERWARTSTVRRSAWIFGSVRTSSSSRTLDSDTETFLRWWCCWEILWFSVKKHLFRYISEHNNHSAQGSKLFKVCSFISPDLRLQGMPNMQTLNAKIGKYIAHNCDGRGKSFT